MNNYILLFFLSSFLFLPGCDLSFFERKILSVDETAEEVVEVSEEKISDEEYSKITQDLKKKIKKSASCQVAEDCDVVEGKCPFGCYIPVNKEYIREIQSDLDHFEPQCLNRCRLKKGVKCEENQCIVVF